MSIHFPKNPFKSFGNIFGHKPKQAGDATDSPRQGGTSRPAGHAGLPPRRTATPHGSSLPPRGKPMPDFASAQAQRTDRRGPPPGAYSFKANERPATGRNAPQAAPPPSQAQKLLSNFKIADLDRMTDAQLGQVVEFLGLPRGSSMGTAPLAANWQRLRKEFSAEEAAKLLKQDASTVVSFLLEPARASSGPTPISIIGMSKQQALQALADRGMNAQQLQALKREFFEHVQHGNSDSGRALSEKYKAFVSDDFTSSAVYSAYAKLLGTLPS